MSNERYREEIACGKGEMSKRRDLLKWLVKRRRHEQLLSITEVDTQSPEQR